MKRFPDWSIHSKLVLPLIMVMVLGGGGIIWVLMVMHDEIVNHALPQERALDGIRRNSLELIGEYREFLVVLNESTLREIDELKDGIEAYEEAFEELVEPHENKVGFVEAIEVAEQKMKRIGDETITARLQLLDHIEEMEGFDATLETAPDAAQVGAVPVNDGHVSKLNEVAGEYISELREYVLGPNETTQREITEIERTLEEILRDYQARGSEPGDQALNAGKFEFIRRLIEAGRDTVSLTNEFLTKFEALETAGHDLRTVLDEAGIVIAKETDEAFETGFANVAGFIIAVMMTVTLVGFFVSRGVLRPVTLLANAAGRIGGGDFKARADLRSKDEIGVLAIAFNQMAGNLESNIEQRERAEDNLKLANKTLLKKAKELARSNAELEQFASIAAHDLQEPLRKVQAFSDRVQDKYADVLDDRGKDYLSRMQNSASRMQILIGNLLTFSRITTNAQPFAPVDLNQIARGVVSDLEIRIQETDARIEFSDMPTIDADPSQMRQLLQNLIGNALKYCRDNIEPLVKVDVKILETALNPAGGLPGRMCEITVADNGIGFEEEYAERIFGIFQRLHGRDKYEGAGVGLAICRKISERHGGFIVGKGRPNEGAEFIVTLPLRHAQT